MASAPCGACRIELLSKENYDTWRLQVEALLTKNDLREYVSGEKVKPELSDKKARSDLILSIQSSELSHRGCETSRAIWLETG